MGCPLPPALILDLERHGSGAGFARAVASALRPAGFACVQRLWNEKFVDGDCPALPAYLAARYDSLMAGVREWGC